MFFRKSLTEKVLDCMGNSALGNAALLGGVAIAGAIAYLMPTKKFVHHEANRVINAVNPQQPEKAAKAE